MYEVELKFHLADVNHVVERLDAMSACFRDSVEQVDRYFSHPVRNFRKTDEALRLRQVGDSRAIDVERPAGRYVSKSQTRN